MTAKYTVQELVDLQIIEKPLDGNHGSIHPTSKDYVEDGIPFIMASDLSNGLVNFSSCKFITEKQANTLRKGFSIAGDILLSHKATIGRTATVQENKYPFLVLTPQVTYYRVKDKQKLNNLYLKYYFDSQYFQSILQQWAGSGSTRAYIGITEQLKLPIILPDIDTQNEIVEIINGLDQKIQLNTQINQTLEQIAQALFKSWFVDFDPVRAKVQALSDGLSLEQAEQAAMQAISGKTPEELTALSQTQPDRYAELAETAKAFPCEMVDVDGVEVPKGWEVKPLGDLISFVKGKKPKAVSPKQEENMLPHILTSSLEGKYNEFCESYKLVTVEYHNTIMLMDGSNSGRVAIGHNGVIGSTLAKINLDNNKLWAVIYQFLKHKEADIQANTTGTTIPHTDKNRVNNYLMTIPNDFLLDKFTELFDKSLLQIISNRNQSIVLETTRDLLLPRLLRGNL